VVPCAERLRPPACKRQAAAAWLRHPACKQQAAAAAPHSAPALQRGGQVAATLHTTRNLFSNQQELTPCPCLAFVAFRSPSTAYLRVTTLLYKVNRYVTGLHPRSHTPSRSLHPTVIRQATAYLLSVKNHLAPVSPPLPSAQLAFVYQDPAARRSRRFANPFVPLFGCLPPG
jgi:hypothetical protein